MITQLTIKGRGYITNEKEGGGALWPPRLSWLVVIWEEADFFRAEAWPGGGHGGRPPPLSDSEENLRGLVKGHEREWG